ncbi:MAG: RimJ/RimL family protein N-acetyltransferase [Salibacteraceae bacterium]|jgi:RimJ/RimL family protein N-acetyltransferase
MTNNALLVREVSQNDYGQYHKIRSENKNLYWTGYDKPPDYNSFKDWFEKRIVDPDKHLYLVYENNNCVGSLNIDYYESYAAIGYSIIEIFEGKGLATKMVEKAILLIKNDAKGRITISKVIAWINENNVGSSRVANKNGMYKSKEQKLKVRFGKEEIYYQYCLELR